MLLMFYNKPWNIPVDNKQELTLNRNDCSPIEFGITKESSDIRWLGLGLHLE